jgi:UBA-like domain
MDCDEEVNSESCKNDNANDINSLLNSLASLNTNEKDDLVVGFQNIANELSYTTARFFLEMNNW